MGYNYFTRTVESTRRSQTHSTNTSYYLIDVDNANSHFVFPILASHIAARAELQKTPPKFRREEKNTVFNEVGRLLSSLSGLKKKKRNLSLV